MSPKLQPVRGTHDILPEEFEKFHRVVSLARDIATLYGFKEMATPIFEATEVFSRSMGETSDVVSKEMFTFQTKGEDGVTLRPEFTAGIARAFISNGMQQHLPLKLFSTGPLFRYERPQKGRQRQFHQVNFEWLGDDSAYADAEIITLGASLLYYLAGKRCAKLHINTLGDNESRNQYREALVAYLSPFVAELSEDSQRRLQLNPLRILDSKDPRDKKITESAPKIINHLSDSSKRRFDEVLEMLTRETIISKMLDIEPDPALVRGLDYYSDTVFEFVAEAGELGAQNTVLAGGRYDGLIEQMGGKPTPSIGFAAGVERLLLLSKDNWMHIDDVKIMVLPFEGTDPGVVHALTGMLRYNLDDIIRNNDTKKQCSVEVAWQGKLSKRMDRASQRGASHVVILGEEEIKNETCSIKNMKTGEQKSISFADLEDREKINNMFNVIG